MSCGLSPLSAPDQKICNNVSRAQSSDLSPHDMLLSKGSSVPIPPESLLARSFHNGHSSMGSGLRLCLSMTLPLLKVVSALDQKDLQRCSREFIFGFELHDMLSSRESVARAQYLTVFSCLIFLNFLFEPTLLYWLIVRYIHAGKS